MNVGWKLVLDFLLRDIDMSSAKAAADPVSGLFIVLSPEPIPRARLRTWRALSHAKGTGPAQRSQLQSAIENGDYLAMYHLFRTLLHYVCQKVYIATSEGDGCLGDSPGDATAVGSGARAAAVLPSSSANRVRPLAEPGAAGNGVQLHWRSQIHYPGSNSLTARGHSLFGRGTTIVVLVSGAASQSLGETFSLYPRLEQDSELLTDAAGLFAQEFDTASVSTPIESSRPGSPVLETPIKVFGTEEPVLCEQCLMLVPPALMASLSCGHELCIACAGACARRHHDTPGATPANMPCPFQGCDAPLSREDVRRFLTVEAYGTLEYNELSMLLRGGAVECPACGFLFERVDGGASANDPLRDKITCIACHANFCAACYSTPFHEGESCRHGGDDANAPRCRYCRNVAVTHEPPLCDAAECLQKGQSACVVRKPCGHMCYGCCGERQCVACLEEGCSDCHPHQTKEDFCVICFSDSLGSAPCLQLDCGHVFHRHCLEEKLEKRWPCARINFRFMQCPLCETEISHHLLAHVLEPIQKLRDQLNIRYAERIRIEGLEHCDALTDPHSRFYQKPLLFAASEFNYYLCSRCSRPYFGGLRRCQDVDREEPDRNNLVCGGCSAGSAVCEVHGPQHLEWKCKYCCNTAVWFCWGTTHFCELCHSPPRKTVREECEGEERCPLKARHPPNGTEFAVGCALCRAGSKS